MAFINAMKESWAEIKPIRHLMSEDELLWFKFFLRAYYCRDLTALAKISPTPDAYENTRVEANWISHEKQRYTVTNARAYGSDYTADSWIPNTNINSNFEDALIEIIDYRRGKSNGKKSEAVRENQAGSSRRAKAKRGTNRQEARAHRDSGQRPARALA